jgi:hypothetical protein
MMKTVDSCVLTVLLWVASMEIWMCVLFAYIGVSIVLFLVSRLVRKYLPQK